MTINRLVTSLALMGAVTAKDHFITTEPRVENEHALVQAAGKQCVLCAFDDTEYPINDSKNKFCVTVAGS